MTNVIEWKQRQALDLPGFEVVQKDSTTITVCGETYNIRKED